jgi:hypothetical protein
MSVLLLMVFIPGLIMGCGKKADPMPLRLSVPRLLTIYGQRGRKRELFCNGLQQFLKEVLESCAASNIPEKKSALIVLEIMWSSAS